MSSKYYGFSKKELTDIITAHLRNSDVQLNKYKGEVFDMNLVQSVDNNDAVTAIIKCRTDVGVHTIELDKPLPVKRKRVFRGDCLAKYTTLFGSRGSSKAIDVHFETVIHFGHEITKFYVTRRATNTTKCFYTVKRVGVKTALFIYGNDYCLDAVAHIVKNKPCRLITFDKHLEYWAVYSGVALKGGVVR